MLSVGDLVEHTPLHSVFPATYIVVNTYRGVSVGLCVWSTPEAPRHCLTEHVCQPSLAIRSPQSVLVPIHECRRIDRAPGFYVPYYFKLTAVFGDTWQEDYAEWQKTASVHETLHEFLTIYSIQPKTALLDSLLVYTSQYLVLFDVLNDEIRFRLTATKPNVLLPLPLFMERARDTTHGLVSRRPSRPFRVSSACHVYLNALDSSALTNPCATLVTAPDACAPDLWVCTTAPRPFDVPKHETLVSEIRAREHTGATGLVGICKLLFQERIGAESEHKSMYTAADGVHCIWLDTAPRYGGMIVLSVALTALARLFRSVETSTHTPENPLFTTLIVSTGAPLRRSRRTRSAVTCIHPVHVARWVDDYTRTEPDRPLRVVLHHLSALLPPLVALCRLATSVWVVQRTSPAWPMHPSAALAALCGPLELGTPEAVQTPETAEPLEVSLVDGTNPALPPLPPLLKQLLLPSCQPYLTRLLEHLKEHHVRNETELVFFNNPLDTNPAIVDLSLHLNLVWS